MRWLLMTLLLLGSLLAVSAADEPTGHVAKVLPLFLDLNGRAATSPSLFDRDAYQAHLRLHTNEISAIRFDVLWSAAHADNAKLKLRLELRGVASDGLPRETTLEQTVTPHYFSHWTELMLGGEDFKNFGEVVAWRATLNADGRMIGEQKSFLW